MKKRDEKYCTVCVKYGDDMYWYMSDADGVCNKNVCICEINYLCELRRGWVLRGENVFYEDTNLTYVEAHLEWDFQKRRYLKDLHFHFQYVEDMYESL